MTPSEVLVRSFYEIVAGGDQDRLTIVLHPEWEMIPPAYPKQAAGPEGYAPVMAGFNRAFPDGSFRVHEVIAAPPKYIVRTTANGTHMGEFLGISATGRSISFDTIDIHEVEGDQIRRSWHIEDFAGFINQVRI